MCFCFVLPYSRYNENAFILSLLPLYDDFNKWQFVVDILQFKTYIPAATTVSEIIKLLSIISFLTLYFCMQLLILMSAVIFCSTYRAALLVCVNQKHRGFILHLFSFSLSLQCALRNSRNTGGVCHVSENI